ncbi:hypothetical protein DL93DRAFT_1659846 [Clavulina sp. PMI_390]|nr:hypothetical protein DL93DRAFT_1659846 [Clavulina sp. PMI_390]
MHSAVFALLTGLALLVSAIIQRRAYTLDIMHALIVLNLCWVIIIGSLMPFSIILPANPGTFVLHGKYFNFLIVASVDIVVMSAFGIWMMSNPARFDNSPNGCAADTVFVILGQHLEDTNHGFRYSLITLYTIFSIPGFNLLLLNWSFSIFFGIPSVFITFLLTKGRQLRPRLPMEYIDFIQVWTMVFVTGGIIISTEQTIQANNISGGENQWGLGQTFAALVALVPCGGVIQQLFAGEEELEGDETQEKRIRALMWPTKRDAAIQTQCPLWDSPNSPLSEKALDEENVHSKDYLQIPSMAARRWSFS